ncbi:MAG: exonuclease SbcCD subunit D [Anaerolineae bacterium]|nr:exonuclease SbcCD subunit D [Anaerolineae bacterium]
MSNQKPLKILHFADAHIDIANYGRHDAETGLPVRVVDFLNALDQIIDRAIEEPVDLVLFAGDAYKDRNPQPTFQREWGKRMMRLARAGIPTVLLVGNHDVSPASKRAHTLQEYSTFEIPQIHVADRLGLIRPEKLGVGVQIATLPWVSRSALLTREETYGKSNDEIMMMLEERVAEGLSRAMEQADPELPLILLAHASVSSMGATYSSERAVMLGHELTLGPALVRDKRWDYVALGHIHKHQSLNEERQPPIVYPGSIERIDFGEAKEQKGFVLAEVARGRASWEFVPLQTRPYVDIPIDTPQAATFMDDVRQQLPAPERIRGAVCRLRFSYPRDWERLLEEAVIREHFAEAFELKLLKHHTHSQRSRLGHVAVESMAPEDLLVLYWQDLGLEETEINAMRELARDVLGGVEV